MSDDFSTRYERNQGAFHAGSGNQYIKQEFTAPKKQRLQTFRELPEDHLVWLKERFVEPKGLCEAHQTLHTTHTVLVDGPVGSGRQTAARILLFQLPALRGRLREVLPEDDEGAWLLDPAQVPRSEGLLLDLADRESVWEKLQGWLPSYHAAVRSAGSRLVVVLPSERRDLDPTLVRHRVRIDGPAVDDVFRVALQVEGLNTGATPPDVTAHLDSITAMHDVAAFAQLVLDARRAAPDGSVRDWYANALGASTRRPEEIAKLLRRLPEGRSRALFLSTAMLEDARTDAVHDASQALLTTLDNPPDERPFLEQDDLFTRLGQFKAAPNSQGHVRFRELRYAASVRDYFWDHRPDLRERIGVWGRTVLTLPALNHRDRQRFTLRFVEQTLRTEESDALLERIRQWADDSHPAVREAAATALLRIAQGDDRTGQNARRELYQWATNQELSDGRAQVLVDVCAGELAHSYPEQALVRLHHVTRRRTPFPLAERRLTELVLTDRRLHRRLLERLARGLYHHHWPVDIRLFIAVTAPPALCDEDTAGHALLSEKGVRAQLVDCWAALFDRVPTRQWSQHVNTWLEDAALVPDDRRDQLIDVLVDACQGRSLPLGLLYRLARPHRVGPLVLRRINAAQNVGRSRPPH
ncbi:hypothetical protein ABZY90_09755 [Streptomyces sp. NPDC006422]|uniref:hypothetical protein n=1 Tax=unclassified Streptomyces TaxID=2593676 RepID=UPI0033AB06C6